MSRRATWPAFRVVQLYIGARHLLALHAAGRLDAERVDEGLQRVERELAALRGAHPAADVVAELLARPALVSGRVLVLLGLALAASLFGGT